MSDERKRILINFSLTKEKGVIRKFIQIIELYGEIQALRYEKLCNPAEISPPKHNA